MKYTILGLLLACSGYFVALAPTPSQAYIVNPLPRFLTVRLAEQKALLVAPFVRSNEPIPAPQRETKKSVDTEALIQAAAEKHQVPAIFIKSIVKAESNFNSNAVSPKGAVGLMQLMPTTARELGADPKDPKQNIDAGTRYLRVLMTKYEKHHNSLTRVIAAYNAGPGAVDRYRGVPPYRETRVYVARVLSYMNDFKKELG